MVKQNDKSSIQILYFMKVEQIQLLQMRFILLPISRFVRQTYHLFIFVYSINHYTIVLY